MAKLSNEELTKINAFINSCNDMINGKFILADVKITKILNMISNSDELYRYISECTIGFNFDKEFHRAEVKNRFNGGEFVPPQTPEGLVAMVFSLLVQFNSKELDFYNFIQVNFATLTPNGEYANFAKVLLVPFRDIIGSHFGLINSVFEPLSSDKYDSPQQLGGEIAQTKEETPQPKNPNSWIEIDKLLDSMIANLMGDKHVKHALQENLIYILKSTKYSLKYKDMRIVTSLLSAYDIMSPKITSTKFEFAQLKNILNQYYEM